MVNGAVGHGVVAFFSESSGRESIETNDADEDVFFHRQGVGGAGLEGTLDVDSGIEQAGRWPRAPRPSDCRRLGCGSCWLPRMDTSTSWQGQRVVAGTGPGVRPGVRTPATPGHLTDDRQP